MQKTYLKTFGMITNYIAKNSYSPSINEIAEARGLSASAIIKHIERLTEAGMITHQKGKRRTITPVL